MPIYEYKCQSCGKIFEKIQKFSDPVLTECVCDKQAPVTKLVSAAAFHLKGGGWYVTDFRDKGGAKGKKDDGDDGGKADKKDGKKADKKADKKGSAAGESKSSESKASDSKPSAATD